MKMVVVGAAGRRRWLGELGLTGLLTLRQG